MRITLHWGRNRDHQLVPLFGGGSVRAVRVGGLRYHAAQHDDGAGEVRPLLLRHVRRRSFCGWMGDGSDSAVGLSAISSQFLTSYRQASSAVSPPCSCSDGALPRRGEARPRPEIGNFLAAKRVPRACANTSSSRLRAFAHVLLSLKPKISRPTTKRRPIGLRGHYSSKCACRLSPRHSRADRMCI